MVSCSAEHEKKRILEEQQPSIASKYIGTQPDDKSENDEIKADYFKPLSALILKVRVDVAVMDIEIDSSVLSSKISTNILKVNQYFYVLFLMEFFRCIIVKL